MTLTVVPETAFVFMMIFARLGTMIMAMPAFGEIIVSSRIRLGLAMSITLVMLPLVQDQYDAIPKTLTAMTFVIFSEIAVGLMIGVSARLLTSALQVAGTVIAFQSGLASVQNLDPTQGIQTAIVGSFLSMVGLLMIFSMDLHHLLIGAMRDSYDLFRPGALLPVGDFAKMAIMTVAGSFKVGIQIAAPFVVFGLLFNLGLGVLSRLMPQVQIYFVAMPANIALGFVLFMLLLSSMMMWYLEYFRDGVGLFLKP